MFRLRELRHQRDLSMKEFGELIGVAESSVSLYETGKRQPDYEMLKKIADFFDVSIDYLLERTDKTTADSINKEEREIETILENTFSDLEKQEGLMFDGVPATKDELEQIKSAMRIGLAMAKEKAKEKYTPNKYKK
jgi:transcriptional regulator with XRE-family HTH domain